MRMMNENVNMKRRICSLISMGLIFVLCVGCAKQKATEVPDDPVVYREGKTVVDIENTEYRAIANDQYTYVLYGTLMDKDVLGKCVGYVDNGTDSTEYVYEINGLDLSKYIVIYDTGSASEMNQPDVFRELSTVDEDAPDNIESFGYPIWN